MVRDFSNSFLFGHLYVLNLRRALVPMHCEPLVQTTEKEVMRKEKHVDEEASSDEEIIYKIDVPANRYLHLDLRFFYERALLMKAVST